MHWFEYDGRNYIVIEDASGFIIQSGEYDCGTAENLLDVLKGYREVRYGKGVMTDLGTQFTSLPRDVK